MVMDRFSRNKLVVIFILTIIVLNGITYYTINKKVSGLGNQISSNKEDLLQAISTNKKDNENQIESLRNEIQTNFATLQDFFDSENKKIKLQLGSINKKVGGLEEKNTELEQKISEINLKSADFSSIVDDIIEAVVSVKTSKGQGSGVIFDSRGYLITNKHVIEGTNSIQIIDSNSDSYSVDVVGSAANADLAILKINSDKTFSYLEFEDSSNINVGERVIAVGNPLGLSFTVTEGIVSGLDRKVDSTDIGYVQTDVPINKGNSGGPLVNVEKKIVGINTFKIIDTEGIGFAIPSNVAEDLANQVVE